ncbi:MAG: hypothetical protein LBF51_01260, partial [Zoogloeaceae bacterium]|nr:hypothetical protein [Zoogloeaceae bacterium]
MQIITHSFARIRHFSVFKRSKDVYIANFRNKRQASRGRSFFLPSTLMEFFMTLRTHILGFPRMGENRELKFALERHWRG